MYFVYLCICSATAVYAFRTPELPSKLSKFQFRIRRNSLDLHYSTPFIRLNFGGVPVIFQSPRHFLLLFLMLLDHGTFFSHQI
jgi:hypothetical protein